MTKKHVQTCPIAGFLNIFGDAWSLLIVREALYGATRFGEFLRHTGIARNILTDRLVMLVDAGILMRVNIGERGARYEYHLTDRGESLLPAIVAISQWSNEQVFGSGHEAVDLCERSSGKKLLKLLPRDRYGNILNVTDIIARAGPGASTAAKARLRAISEG